LKSVHKTKIAFIAALGIAFCVAMMGDVRAQETLGALDESGIDLSIEKAGANLSGAQRVAWVDEQMAVVKGIYRRVQNMLDKARQEKDTIKITCLDDKLTQIHVNLRGVEERQAALEIAMNSGDGSTADQQFTILKIYISRIQGLMAEAESCIGDTDVVIGESETTVTIDEDITVEDPTEPPDVPIGVEQPPHASGFF